MSRDPNDRTYREALKRQVERKRATARMFIVMSAAWCLGWIVWDTFIGWDWSIVCLVLILYGDLWLWRLTRKLPDE